MILYMELIARLNPQERAYVDARLLGLTPHQAAARANFAHPEVAWPIQEAKPAVSAAIAAGFEEAKQKFQVTREEVVDGIREGIDIAKLASDAASVIRGWSEIARICGLVAPQQTQVKVDVTTQMLLPSQYQELSDAELLRLVDKQRTLEGEYELSTAETDAGGAAEVEGDAASDWPPDLPRVPADEAEDELSHLDDGSGRLLSTVQGVRVGRGSRPFAQADVGAAVKKKYARRAKGRHEGGGKGRSAAALGDTAGKTQA
jgi:hypothetical protein